MIWVLKYCRFTYRYKSASLLTWLHFPCQFLLLITMCCIIRSLIGDGTRHTWEESDSPQWESIITLKLIILKQNHLVLPQLDLVVCVIRSSRYLQFDENADVLGLINRGQQLNLHIWMHCYTSDFAEKCLINNKLFKNIYVKFALEIQYKFIFEWYRMKLYRKVQSCGYFDSLI